MILKPTYMMSEVFMDCGQLLFGTDWHTNCGNGACSFADILISAMQRIIYRNIRVAVEYWNIPPPLILLFYHQLTVFQLPSLSKVGYSEICSID